MTEPDRADRSLGRGPALLGLACALALAAALRSIGLERVFLDDGNVVFGNSDAFYHARRVLFTLAQYPDWLRFDACINYPDGAAVPHPPGYDFLLATLTKLAGGSVAAFEKIAAWLPVLLGALTVLPVYALGRAFAGRGVGLGGALLYAALPIAVNYSQVGNADHHAAAGLLGATLLASYVKLLGVSPPARLALCFVALLFNRLAMLLVWHGSLLYLGIGELAVLLLAATDGRRDLLRGQALSCLGVAIALLPIVAASAAPRDGAYAATELSRLHVLLFACEAAASALLFRLLSSERFRSARSRLLLATGVAGAFGGLLLLIPGVVDAVLAASAFLAKSDEWGASVVEQLPLFYENAVLSFGAGEKWMGYLAYLLPLVPIAFVPQLEDSRSRSRALLMIVWTLVFGVLAFSQVRYGNDYAAAGCIGAALGIAQLAGWASKRSALAARLPLAALGGLLLIAPTWPRYYSILLESSLAMAGESAPSMDRALLSLEGTQLRFAERVRRSTPESPGCGPEPGVPDYGILAHPAIGHVLHYVGRRATPVDPFGPYIGQRNFDRLQRALRSSSEEEVLEIAEQLRARYLLSADDGSPTEDSVMQRLHRSDGSAEASLAQLGRFRLVEEGPAGGVALAVLFEAESREAIPYKLFEIVPGAVLEVEAEPGQRVTAATSVIASSGRRFVYRAESRADAQGKARLRVPYATGNSGPAAIAGVYRVVAGDRSWQVAVPESAVLEGRVLRVAASRD